MDISSLTPTVPLERAGEQGLSQNVRTEEESLTPVDTERLLVELQAKKSVGDQTVVKGVMIGGGIAAVITGSILANIVANGVHFLGDKSDTPLFAGVMGALIGFAVGGVIGAVLQAMWQKNKATEILEMDYDSRG